MNSANEMLKAPLDLFHWEAEEIDLREYFGIINRNKWSIAGLTMVICLLTIVVVFSMSPVYKATATLLIESEQANVVSIEEVYGIDSSQREYYQTQFEILNSRTLVERVIAELNVRLHPEYDPDVEGGKSLRSYIPFLPPPEPKSEGQKKQTITKRFIENLVISPIRNTQLVNISFESEDPVLAPKVANALGNAYINSHLEARLELTQKAASWLTDRLAGMRKDLELSERQLRAYQERENLVDVGGVKTVTANQLDEQTRRLVAAGKSTAAARSQFEAAGSVKGAYNPRWETLQGVLADELSQDLKSYEADSENNFSELTKRYGPKHPKYIAAKSQLVSTQQAFRSRVRQIVGGFEDTYKQAVADMRAIEKAQDASKQEIQEINRKSYELSQLQRTVTTNKQLYDMFFQRFQETNQTDFAAANARFVDTAARPFEPVKPRKALIVGLAGVLSMIIGILLSFLRAALDNTIRSGEQLEEKLGLSVLGIIPFEKKAEEAGDIARLYVDQSHNSFAEAVRSLRTSVVLSGLEHPHKITLVTSSVPGEGKTTVASNLALALGQMEKVLLIDADMRRPSLAEDYNLAKYAPGLSELVAGTCKGSECIHHLEDLGIDLMTSGAVPPNPLDLLSSKRFKELLQQLSSRYDRIIIDSAPTQSVSDSLVLSTHADALIYLVKSDSTPINVVQNGLQRLTRVGAPIIGAVLNQFDADTAQKYGYSGGGKYGYYGYGYASKNYG